MANVLELENVSKAFGSLQILRSVNLSIEEGESVAILGESGAGKSTLLHICGLMEQASAGRVALKGVDCSPLSSDARARQRLDAVGFLFQFHYLLPDFSVLENVLMPARLAGDDLAKVESQARALLERVGLASRLTHRPHELSGGEQQRAGLVRALIRRPALLLCDEPTGNLDPVTAFSVADGIWSEMTRGQVATILVTHNELLAQRADRAFDVKDGTLQEHVWRK
jgi:lipoprotein-releasing system ATP-binding protein